MKEAAKENDEKVPKQSIAREILSETSQEEKDEVALYARQLVSDAAADRTQAQGNQEGKLEAAHMTKRGLYIPGVDLYQEEQRSNLGEIYEPDASGRVMPKSMSPKSRGGEFGTPKFKEKLKVKNFKQRITELFKSRRNNDSQN